MQIRYLNTSLSIIQITLPKEQCKGTCKAQHDGNFSGYSAHVYVDDTEAYQATPFDTGGALGMSC